MGMLKVSCDNFNNYFAVFMFMAIPTDLRNYTGSGRGFFVNIIMLKHVELADLELYDVIMGMPFAVIR